MPRVSDWKRIPGFPDYSINKQGQIRRISYHSFKPAKILKTVMSRGYVKIKLVQNGVRRFTLVSRLLALAFHKPPDDLYRLETQTKDPSKPLDYRNTRFVYKGRYNPRRVAKIREGVAKAVYRRKYGHLTNES